MVLKPEATGWDKYCRRINSVLELDGRYLAFYDGSASEAENYEERTGIAVSTDLKSWTVRTPDAPCWTSPYGSNSLRYIDAVKIGNEVKLFYEFARPDGAHDLRMISVEQARLVQAAAI